MADFQDIKHYKIVDECGYTWYKDIKNVEQAIQYVESLFRGYNWNAGTKLHLVEVNEKLYNTYEKE